MIFSIVIPTKDRYEILFENLKFISQLDFPKKDFEVIVVDNNSCDSRYKELVNKKFNFNLKYTKETKKGAAAARNKGIKLSSGIYILFLGDDTYPDKNLLNEHLYSYEKGADMVLGFVTWFPSLNITNFMNLIAPYGPQFNFNIKDVHNVDYKHFYTSNISIPRDFLIDDNFNEIFEDCNIEDIELGYRLLNIKRNKLFFNKNAIVYHNHVQDIDKYFTRQKIMGRNKKLFIELHPELRKNLWNKKILLRLIMIKNNVLLLIFDNFLLERFFIDKITLKKLENSWIREFIN